MIKDAIIGILIGAGLVLIVVLIVYFLVYFNIHLPWPPGTPTPIP